MPSDFNSLDGTLPTPGAGRLWFLAGGVGVGVQERSSVPKSWPELRIRKAAAHTRIVSGWRVLPGSTGVITTSQVHRLRTDSGVRVLRPQPRSRLYRLPM